MNIRFHERNNPYIDELVQLCWNTHKSYKGKVFHIEERDKDKLFYLINDVDKEGTGEAIPPEQNLNIDIPPIKEQFEAEPKKFVINRFLIAVDGGIAKLGDFVGGGTAFAVRGSAVCYIDGEITILRYSTGAIIIDESNQVEAFLYIGRKLGNECLYLNKDPAGNFYPKAAAFETSNQAQDRFRNFVERMIQEEALGLLASNGKGLLLLDGAIPGGSGTYDTPGIYLESFLKAAINNLVDVAAISKKSTLSLNGVPISDLLDNYPSVIGYIPLMDALEQEREERKALGETIRGAGDITLGNQIYAARFGLGPPANSFRVDVKNSMRSTPDEVIRAIYNNCQIQSCYPKPLVEAHQACSFFYQDVQLLTADIIARTGAIPKEDSSMEWIFQPFGAFGK